MQVNYYIERVYGVDQKYVVNNEQAAAIRTLTGKKTIADRDIYALIALGHTFKEVIKPR